VASENKKSYSTGEQEIAGEILAKNRNKKNLYLSQNLIEK